MSIYVGDVYRGYTRRNGSYLFKIIETSEAYNAVLVECVKNPVFVIAGKELCALIGNFKSSLGVSANSKRNTTQNLVIENMHLAINGKLPFNIEDDRTSVMVGFRYWVDVNRLQDYKLFSKHGDIWLELERMLLENGT